MKEKRPEKKASYRKKKFSLYIKIAILFKKGGKVDGSSKIRHIVSTGPNEATLNLNRLWVLQETYFFLKHTESKVLQSKSNEENL